MRLTMRRYLVDSAHARASLSELLRGLAVGCARAWTSLYTCGMPPAMRDGRRAEIESDLWACQRDADDDRAGSPLHILLRVLLGMPDDLGWRLDQAARIGTLTQRSIAVSARVAGAALFICALWVIDADASRKRPVTVIRQVAPLSARSTLPDRAALAWLRTPADGPSAAVSGTSNAWLPEFALVVARPDGPLGPNLIRSFAIGCDGGLTTPGLAGIRFEPADDLLPACVRIGHGTLSADSRSAGELATILSDLVDGEVVDRTGLAGRYDAVLTWMPARLALPSAREAQGRSPADRTSIVAAIREQWGLTLEPARQRD